MTLCRFCLLFYDEFQKGHSMDYENRADVYKNISAGFCAFERLARAGIRDNWTDMPLSQRCASVRALVNIREYARNPEKYFSRKYTEQDWNKRAVAWCAKNNIENRLAYSAYYVIPGPAELVYTASLSAFYNNNDIGQRYYNFCRAIQEWEYTRTSTSPTARDTAYLLMQEISHAARWAINVMRFKNNMFYVVISKTRKRLK